MRRAVGLVILAVVSIAVGVTAQRGGPAPDPLVKEDITVKVAPHTYVIPDGNVGLVPNVGIVVGSRATLVIDPGLGRRNGEAVLREVAKVSKNTEIFIASTHFHAEHTTGYGAFPARRSTSTRRCRRRSSSRAACRWCRCSPDGRRSRPRY